MVSKKKLKRGAIKIMDIKLTIGFDAPTIKAIQELSAALTVRAVVAPVNRVSDKRLAELAAKADAPAAKVRTVVAKEPEGIVLAPMTEAAPEVSKYTAIDVRKAMVEAKAAGKLKEAKKALKDIGGVSMVSDLKANLYEAVIDAVSAL